jgi:hypothetical protein
VIVASATDSLPKDWILEAPIKHLFDSLDEEIKCIESDRLERLNPDRRQRILRIEAAIVSEALKHWG